MAETTTKTPEQRIVELQAQLKAVEDTHAFQAKRGDELETKLGDLQAKHDFQRKRADKAEATLKIRQTAVPTDQVILGGVSYGIVGTFRADNTFVEVKRGHCEEGATLVAIDKVH